MTDNNKKHILILGGGTAGWMAANYLIKKLDPQIHKISLVESPDIGIIGVGEGSTPSLKNFFDDIGVDEKDWMPACNATYKVGITFKGWSGKKGFDQYCHPFPSDLDVFSSRQFALNCHLRRRNYDVDVHPDHFFLQSYMAAQGLAPKPTENFPFTHYYGYHFDSGLLGQYLARVAVGRGVQHISAKVDDILLDKRGNVSTLILADNCQLEADFFIDCSGFGSLIMQQKLAVPFVSFKENLFNDSAIVAPTDRKKPLNSQTISSALSAGWAWDIPLTNRTGNGYVYSSDFISDDQAEEEFRAHINLPKETETRLLKFKVGRVAEHWRNNAIAIGLSQGFIEPLEATALHLVQATILEFIEQWKEGEYQPENVKHFNEKINGRFEGVRDYIVAHYRLNTRTDSEYWLANQKNNQLSDSLTRILHAWTGALPHDIDQEIAQQKIGGYFPVDSWRILLAGYGFFPEQSDAINAAGAFRGCDMAKQDSWLRRCGLNYPTQESLF